MTETTAALLHAYCERAGQPGLFAEPLNAATNLGFVVAAALAGRALARTRPPQAAVLWLLIAFLLAIGIGSSAWHLAPTPHTELMDVIPIGLFINLYLPVALRRLLGLPWAAAGGLWAVYFAADATAQSLLPADLFNGSVMYLPALLALGLITLAVRRRDSAAGRTFAQALGVFAVSLSLHTGDLALCESFPWGTHFLWHLLNSWVLWRLLRTLIDRSGGAGPSPA